MVSMAGCAFNVSPRQVERPDFFVKLRQSFADAGVPLTLIELEFTESAAMEVSAAVLEDIAGLRGDGARIAIDDFGTGYSNFARLRAMPLDRVKLDPSLIADIDTQREGPGHRPGGHPADQGRRAAKSSPKRSRRSRKPISCARWAATRSRATSSRAPMFEQEFLAWTGNARGRGAKSVA